MANEYLHAPGAEVPVEVLADSAGDVADEGQAVALVGENADYTTVELVEAVSDRAIGILKDEPADLEDPDVAESDISAGNSAGPATLILFAPVIWMEVDSGYSSPSVGDYVQVGDGGDVEAYTGPTAAGQGGAVTQTLGIDANGNLETNNASDIDVDFTKDAFPFGMVFSTVASEWGIGDKVAVMRGVF